MQESVFLIGCRAVGKSSIGKKLAEKLFCAYLDTDTMIVDSLGRSVAEIVKKDGWQRFRDQEKKVLQQLLEKERCVVATGGGAILHTAEWAELKKKGKVVWLTADPDVLCTRIRADARSDALRPSLTGKDICRELEEVLAERSPLYDAVADFSIDTGKMDVVAAVSEILLLMEEKNHGRKYIWKSLSGKYLG